MARGTARPRPGAARGRPGTTPLQLGADEQARFAIEAAEIGTWSWDFASGGVRWSTQQEALFGLPPGTFAGTLDAFLDLLHPDDRPAVAAAARSLDDGPDHRFEFRVVRPDGAVRWLAGTGRVVRDDARGAAGAPVGMLGVTMDVTDRRLVEEDLRASRNQLEAIFRSVTDGITVQSATGRLTYANDAAARVIGYPSAQDLLAASVAEIMRRFELMDEAGRPLSPAELPGRQALQGAHPPDQLVRYRVRETGEERWSLVKATPVPGEDGTTRYAVNVFRDVTEQRRAEETLRDSEARYRLLFESNPHPMWVFDLATLRFLAVNNAALEQYGYGRDEFLAMTLLDIRPPEDAPAIRAKAARIAAEPEGLDQAGVWRHRKRDGTLFQAEVITHALELDGRPARLSLAIDVTERERVAADRARLLEQLESERARLAAVLEQLPVGVIIAEAPSGRMVLGNAQIERILGHPYYEAADVAGYGRYGGIHADGRPFAPEDYPLARALRSGQTVPTEEMRYRRGDGTEAVLRVGAAPVRDAEGTVIAGVVIFDDVTERRRAEEDLARLAAIVEGSQDAIIGRTLDGTITAWNRGAERMYGYTREEAIGHNIAMTIPPELLHERDAFSAAATRGQSLEHVEAVRRRKDGTRVDVALSLSPIRDGGGRVVGVSAIARDVTERKRVEEDQRFLADVSTTLAASLDYEATLSTVARLAVPRLADLCVVDVAELGGGLRRVAVAHADPAQEALAWEIERRWPTLADADVGPARVLGTGRPEIVPEVPGAALAAAAHDADHLDAIRRMGFRSYLAVPLMARGRALGVLTFVAAESGRAYGPADLPLAEEVARRAALAVDNARLYVAEQHARAEAERATARIARLQAVTAALADALTIDDVARIVVDQGIAALGAAAGSLALPTADGTAVEVVRTAGYAPALVEPWRRFPPDAPVALADALRGGEPVLLRSPEELAARYPVVAGVAGATPHRSFAALPLLLEGRAIGALGLSFAEPQPFGVDDLAFMLALARQSAQALERARLYAAERDARGRAEAARERLTFLAEASTTLSASLDYEATLRSVADLAVRSLADWCAVHVVGEDGTVEPLAVVHVDPDKVAWARALQEKYPYDPDAPTGIPQVLRTGRPEIYPDIPDALLAAAARDAEHLAILRAVGMRSVMIVPLFSRDRALGAISFIAAESGRHYGPEDLALAEDLARRCAVAIENARLYREAQEAVRARDEFLSIASHELRTPVTSIKGYAQMLLRAQAREGIASERTGQFLRTIDEATDRLGVLTNDLLDVSRIRLGQLPLRLRPLDLAALARTVVDRYGAQTGERHQLALAVEGEPGPVVADPDRTEQILTNLLDNAAKYSPDGGPIRVTVAPEDGGVLLSVADQGIGLPADEVEAIFEPFNRAANATRGDLPGLGLGLYICRSIAERHGGRIWAESPGEGQGTTLRLWLPTNEDSGLRTQDSVEPATP